MDKKQAIEIAGSYKKEISKLIGYSRVYLYGSYSKGTAREDSDIDIAVIVPQLKDDWLVTVKKLWRAGRTVSSLIEPVLIEEGEMSPLYDEIKKWGIAIS